MKTYYIYTDSGSGEIEAENVSEALARWGWAPKGVSSVEAFKKWLEQCGGFGGIHEDGTPIAKVGGELL